MLSLSLLSFLIFPVHIWAFQFSFNPPSQCDDLGLKWTGGSPPFTLHMIPVFGTKRDVSIPSSAFSNGKGSYSLQLPFKKDSQIVFTMSDQTGFDAGGTSNVYTVLQSKGGTCNTTVPGTDFVFQLNSNLQQCRPFTFTGYDAAIPPVTIGIIIPGGSAVTLTPPAGQDSYDWTVNAARGTSMIFFMSDSQGREGGTSDIRSVGASDDSSCLDNTSPSTTSNAPGPTQTSPGAQPSSSVAPPPSPISAASIAGAIIGSVLFLAIVITLALFFLKRMHTDGSKTQAPLRADLTDGDAMHPHGVNPYGYPSLHTPKYQFDSGPLTPPSGGGNKYAASEASFPDTITQFPSPALYPPQPHHLYTPQSPNFSVNLPASPLEHDSELAYASSARASSQASLLLDSRHSSTAHQAASTGMSSQLPSRYILHTDAEDAAPDEGGLIELPPQYSARPGPGRFDSPATPSYDIKHPL